MIDFSAYTVEADARFRHPGLNERKGQAFFNELLVVRPDIAERVRGTVLDPFYQDARLPEFLSFVAKEW